MSGDTRSRMVEAALSALQHDGVAGMSFTDVLRASGAARGAIYHHFPGGKAELVAEATRHNGEQVLAALAALPTDSPRRFVEAFLLAVRPVVAASAAGGGCAVAAASVGADAEGTGLRQLAGDTFAAWEETLAGGLRAAGMRRPAARELATTLLALLEGAHVLCRAAGDLRPLDRIARTAGSLVPA